METEKDRTPDDMVVSQFFFYFFFYLLSFIFYFLFFIFYFFFLIHFFFIHFSEKLVTLSISWTKRPSMRDCMRKRIFIIFNIKKHDQTKPSTNEKDVHVPNHHTVALMTGVLVAGSFMRSCWVKLSQKPHICLSYPRVSLVFHCLWLVAL